MELVLIVVGMKTELLILLYMAEERYLNNSVFFRPDITKLVDCKYGSACLPKSRKF